MKYNTSSLLALGLAGTAFADTWVDWSSTTTTTTTTSKVVDPTSSVAWEDWSSSTTTTKPVDPTTSSAAWDDWSKKSSSSASVKKSSSTAVSGSSSAYWSDWAKTSGKASSSSSVPVKASTSASGAWGSACGAPSTVTKTETETSYGATTTVYRSTVYVGQGPVSTVYTCGPSAPAGPADGPAGSWGGASSPVLAASAASSAVGWGPGSPVAASTATGSAGSWGPAAPVAASSATGPAGSWGPGYSTGVAGSTITVSPTASASGKWGAGGDWGPGKLNPGVSGSIIGTDGDVWSWTHTPAADPTSTPAAPTYTGWGDWSGEKGGGSNGTGPAPGTDLSNCTKPHPPLKDNSCNGAGSRSQWCGGFSIDSDYYNVGPDTGVTCKYDLTITNTTLNFEGIDRLALAINGQVPGPLIECNWGDLIQISVTNQMTDNATSIHWHGITQTGGTNDQDGVPGVTECAIAPGTTRVYKFKAKQYGTGWYHSHLLAQLGDGVRGPMVIHGPATANYDIDMGTVMIDDLFGNGTAPLTAAQANSRIAHSGPSGTWNYLLNGANTSPDLTKGKHALWTVKPGKKHLFRIINSASQNMWSVHFDNHKMTVIATDYVPITPYTTEWLNIAIGQRYDVIVEADQPTSGYFLRAVTQTGCPSTCVNNGLGSSNGIILYEGADAVLPTSTSGNKTIADFAFCLDEPIASLTPYLKKSAGSSSAFTASASTLPAGNVANVATSDDGRVFRWFLNNGAININYTQPTLKTLAQTGNANSSLISNPIILGSKNQWVYFVIANQFFASHPMHLHGHDLSLLGQGTTPWNPSLVSTLNFENPPRRDTALLIGSRGVGFAPGYTVIGFETDNPGVWLMHCHIVWHVDGGLALQWIERPDDINAERYANSAQFKNECSAMEAYEAAGGKVKTSAESGLRRRSPYFEDLLNARSESVVRRSETAEKRYIDSYVRRGLGDGFKPRRHGLR